MYRYKMGTFEKVMFNVKTKGDPHIDLARQRMDKHELDGQRVIGEGFAKLLDPNLVASENEPEMSRLVHDSVEGNKAYDRLARSCAGNTELAASVAGALFPKVIEGLPKPKEKENNDGQPNDDKDDEPGLSPADESRMRRALRAGMKAADEVVEQHQTGERVFGQGWDDTKGQMIDGEYQPGEADKWLDDGKLKRILRLAGRLVPISEKKAAKSKAEGVGALVGVKKGRSVDALPHEYAKLSSPALRNLFYARFAGRNLDVWKRESKRDMGLGPIIVCLDQSDSMNGSADELAKAITVATAAQARLEGREFALILYAHDVIHTSFGHSPSDLIRAMGNRPNGGTDFGAPLTCAYNLICEDHHYGLGNADVLFITDGNAREQPQLLESFTEVGANVIGVAIASEVSPQLAESTHTAHTLPELTSHHAAKLMEAI